MNFFSNLCKLPVIAWLLIPPTKSLKTPPQYLLVGAAMLPLALEAEIQKRHLVATLWHPRASTRFTRNQNLTFNKDVVKRTSGSGGGNIFISGDCWIISDLTVNFKSGIVTNRILSTAESHFLAHTDFVELVLQVSVLAFPVKGCETAFDASVVLKAAFGRAGR